MKARYRAGQVVWYKSEEWTIDEVHTIDAVGDDGISYTLERSQDGSYYSPIETRYMIPEIEVHHLSMPERLARIEKILNLD